MRRNRRSLRLHGYDYAQEGAYFITICTHNRGYLFGDVRDGEMNLNDAGRIAADEWMRTADIRREIELDEWVVMPNHLHGIIIIVACWGDPPVAPTGGRPVVRGGDPPVARTGGWRVAGGGDPPVAPTGGLPVACGGDPSVARTGGWRVAGGGDPLVAPTGGRPTGPPPRSIGAIIAGFKSAATKRINESRHTPSVRIWQRNYYEHVIRNDRSLNRIREYIAHNPARWEWDRENLNRSRTTESESEIAGLLRKVTG